MCIRSLVGIQYSFEENKSIQAIDLYHIDEKYKTKITTFDTTELKNAINHFKMPVNQILDGEPTDIKRRKKVDNQSSRRKPCPSGQG